MSLESNDDACTYPHACTYARMHTPARFLTKISTVQQLGAQEWLMNRVALPQAVASTMEPFLSLKKYVLPPMLCTYCASLHTKFQDAQQRRPNKWMFTRNCVELCTHKSMKVCTRPRKV